MTEDVEVWCAEKSPVLIFQPSGRIVKGQAVDGFSVHGWTAGLGKLLRPEASRLPINRQPTNRAARKAATSR
jgi:hypothetical protein